MDFAVLSESLLFSGSEKELLGGRWMRHVDEDMFGGIAVFVFVCEFQLFFFFFWGGGVVVFIVFDFRVVFIVLYMPSLRSIGIKVGSLFFSRSQSIFPRHAVGIRAVFPDENTLATDYLLSWAKDGWTSPHLY